MKMKRTFVNISYFSTAILVIWFPNYPTSAINLDLPVWRDRLRSLRMFSDCGIMGMAKPIRLRGGSSWGSWNSGSSSAKKLWNPENDVEVDQVQKDGITSLSFSPKALAPKHYMVTTSWDCEVRCWSVDAATAKAEPVGSQRHERPALCSGWTSDGSGILTGGADGRVMLWDIYRGTWAQIGQHDGPVRAVAHSELPSPCAVTASWDKTVRFWQLGGGTGQPLAVLQMPERVYAMDIKGCVLVVATAERHILVYDLRNPGQPFRQKFSPLKYQTRCVSVFPDQRGFCVGSVEGRVAVEHIQDPDLPKNFAFKCHRQNVESKDPELHAVNVIAFTPSGTFATGGGDGAFNFWDKDDKRRLRAFSRSNQPISAGAFSHDGALFAYAVGYDWCRGAAGHLALSDEQRKPHVMIHRVKDECTPKAAAKPEPTKRW